MTSDGFIVARRKPVGLVPVALNEQWSVANSSEMYEQVFIPFGDPHSRVYGTVARAYRRDGRAITAVMLGWRLYLQLSWNRETRCRQDLTRLVTPAGMVELVVTEEYPDVCMVLRPPGGVRPGRDVPFEADEELSVTVTREDITDG